MRPVQRRRACRAAGVDQLARTAPRRPDLSLAAGIPIDNDVATQRAEMTLKTSKSEGGMAVSRIRCLKRVHFNKKECCSHGISERHSQ